MPLISKSRLYKALPPSIADQVSELAGRRNDSRAESRTDRPATSVGQEAPSTRNNNNKAISYRYSPEPSSRPSTVSGRPPHTGTRRIRVKQSGVCLKTSTPTQTAPATTQTAPNSTLTAPATTHTAPATTHTGHATTQTASTPTRTASAPIRTAPATTQTASTPTQDTGTMTTATPERPHTALSLVSLISIERSVDLSKPSDALAVPTRIADIHNEPARQVSRCAVEAFVEESDKRKHEDSVFTSDQSVKDVSKPRATRAADEDCALTNKQSNVVVNAKPASASKRKVSFCLEAIDVESVSDNIAIANAEVIPRENNAVANNKGDDRTIAEIVDSRSATGNLQLVKGSAIPATPASRSAKHCSLFKELIALTNDSVSSTAEPIVNSPINAPCSKPVKNDGRIFSVPIESRDPHSNGNEQRSPATPKAFEKNASTKFVPAIVSATSKENAPARSASFRTRLRSAQSLNKVDLWEEDEELINERTNGGFKARTWKPIIASKSIDSVVNVKRLSTTRNRADSAGEPGSGTMETAASRRRASVPLSSDKSATSSRSTSVWSASPGVSPGASARRSFDIAWPCVRVIDSEHNVRTVPLELFTKKATTNHAEAADCAQEFVLIERRHTFSTPRSSAMINQPALVVVGKSLSGNSCASTKQPSEDVEVSSLSAMDDQNPVSEEEQKPREFLI